MARILEHHSKALIRKLGVPVPEGIAASTAEEAQVAAEKIGFPVVIKALVPSGKRGKAGAIRFANTSEEAFHEAESILGLTVSFYPVEKVLVEQRISIKKELYLSISIDKIHRQPIIIASSVGGIDIEELSIEQPDKISYTHVDPIRGLTGYKAIEIWSDLGLEGNILRQASTILSKLFNAFMQYDANILEINPLVITATDEVLVAASVMGVDENALFRQPELKDMVQVGSDRTWRPLTELEKHMVTVNEQEAYRGTARYTEMDGGDIGVMCGGGGASLLLMDALIKAGGRPANYSEVGGNPPENKVFGLCKGILSKKGVRGFFLGHNITSNTQIDVVASGVVRAFQDLKIDPKTFPVVVREAGTHDTEGKLIFEKYGIEYNGDDITLTQAAQKMVAKMRQVYPDYDQWGDK